MISEIADALCIETYVIVIKLQSNEFERKIKLFDRLLMLNLILRFIDLIKYLLGLVKEKILYIIVMNIFHHLFQNNVFIG